MRTTKRYPVLARRTFRPEVTTCVSCGTRLRRRVTLSRRVGITQNRPLQLPPSGYPCPNQACGVPALPYRRGVDCRSALSRVLLCTACILSICHLSLPL